MSMPLEVRNRTLEIACGRLRLEKQSLKKKLGEAKKNLVSARITARDAKARVKSLERKLEKVLPASTAEADNAPTEKPLVLVRGFDFEDDAPTAREVVGLLDAARLFGISERKLYRLVHSQKIRFYKAQLSNRIWLRRSDLQTLVERAANTFQTETP